MMKWIGRILGAAVVLVVLLAAGSFLLPRHIEALGGRIRFLALHALFDGPFVQTGHGLQINRDLRIDMFDLRQHERAQNRARRLTLFIAVQPKALGQICWAPKTNLFHGNSGCKIFHAPGLDPRP